MLLATEKSASSIQEDHLLIEGEDPLRIADTDVITVSLFETDTTADQPTHGLRIRYRDQDANEKLVSVDHHPFPIEELCRYVDRVAVHAAAAITREVGTGNPLEFGHVTFRETGATFSAEGVSHSVEYAEITAVESLEGDTLLWHAKDLEPFAILRMTDPYAAVLRELCSRSVPSSTQQTDWIAADQDFFQMVGPIECHERTFVPSFATLRVIAIALGSVLAVASWLVIPKFAIYVCGIIALALTAGIVVLTNQANQSGTILAVFRRGVTLFGAGSDDIVISWLDLTDAKLETQSKQNVDDTARESVTLELTTSPEIGKVIKLAWDAKPADKLAFGYLRQQLQQRIWKHKKR
ncbi:MAG: hypothetical protein AAFX06_22400 [Planctomycetota bacterium]